MNQEKIVISIDAMGSERGPKAVVDGILQSAEMNPNVEFIVHGDEVSISKLIENSNLQSRCQILNS
ncbi:MAG: glycerol-3-phosphate acyltransferase PlsX, partial [Paracoccaceae bacterium]